MRTFKSMPVFTHKRTLGFTLVELLIAITLGLLLLAGLLGVFVSNKKAAQFTKEQSRVQEEGRFSVGYIRKFLHVAGYDELFKPLQAGEYSGASPLMVSASDSRDGTAAKPSDILVLTYEIPEFDGLPSTNTSSFRYNLRTCDGSKPANSVTKVREEFFVDDDNVFRCLSKNAVDGEAFNTEAGYKGAELAAGVLDFQVQYGVNLTSDVNIEPENFTYLNATQLEGKGWGTRGVAQRVMSIKYALLIEAESRLDTGSSTSDDIYYVLDNTVNHTGLVANIYTSSFKLRNGG